MIIAIVNGEGDVCSASAGCVLEVADVSVRHEDDVVTVALPHTVGDAVEEDGAEEDSRHLVEIRDRERIKDVGPGSVLETVFDCCGTEARTI